LFNTTVHSVPDIGPQVAIHIINTGYHLRFTIFRFHGLFLYYTL